MKRRSVSLLVVLLALSAWDGRGVLLAQQSSPSGVPNPGAVPSALLQPNDGVATLRTRARLVLLDVVVTNGKGRPVQGLKASDFTLLEDGAPQVLSSFEEHRPITVEEAAKAAAAVKLPPNHFTNYEPVPNESAATVFLLDALDTPVQAQMYLREQMIAYMKTVPAGTKIAIFQLDTQMRMIQGFTSDQEVLRQVVNSKRNQPEISPMLGGPMAPNYARERMRLDILTQGMQGLARYLAPFPGRKNLIWFTARVPVPLYGPGFDVPFPDMTSFIDDFSKTTDVLTLSRIAVYPVDARGLQTGPVSGGGRRGGIGGFETRQFYQKAMLQVTDAGIRKLLGDLEEIERKHQVAAEAMSESITPAEKNAEDVAQRRLFVLQIVQPGLAGLMDGSVSTLAPVFAAAFATKSSHDAFVVGLAASIGAGISMAFAEALSDDGSMTGRGRPMLRGAVTGLMTAAGGIGHTLPFLLTNFHAAFTAAVIIVALELATIAWIRNRYMDTPLLSAAFQVVVGGVLVFAVGIWIGSS